MREIEFRGKSMDSGRWLYGDLTYYAGGAQIWVQCEDGKWNYLVAPDTVGQYTGILDRKGVRVFEGDIVVNHTGYYGDKISPVVFENGMFHCGRSEQSSRRREHYYMLRSERIEVIGNVYDAPELLTQSGTA